MDTKDILQSISSHGLHPIPVEGDADKENAQAPIFQGTLEDYFIAAKVLEAKAIFVSVDKLEEADLVYEIEDDDDEYEDELDDDTEGVTANSPSESTEVDLTLAAPNLSTYKNKIGTEHSFKLAIVKDFGGLEFFLEESWWQSFSEERNVAIEKVDEDREAYREKMEKQRIEKEKDLIKTIKQLIKDEEFVRIPTQRGMINYALENVPNAEGLSERSLKEEIQNLRDKIIAKGLNKKRR
ncbi:MAG: hypothetical protein ABSA44_11800 [Bacteroidota bacterium]|jgi:hypothetical protein